MNRSISTGFALCVLTLAMSVPNAKCQSSTAPDKVTQKNEAKALKWKERILKVPVGTFVKGKLDNQQEFEGQLRDISDSTFSVQCLKGNKIEMVAIRYEEMKSLSAAGQPSTGEKIAKGLLSF